MAKQYQPLEMQETDDTRRVTKANAHSDLIDMFIDRWYDIDSQDKEKEIWENGAIISIIETTILTPPNDSLPEMRLENKEILWKYDYQLNTFVPHDEPVFRLKAYKRVNTLGSSQFWEWEEMDLN